MPKDKKVISALSAPQEESQQYSTDKASVVKKRRRDMHKQLSSDKREAFLLQRRTRYRESYNENLLNGSPASTNNEESAPSYPQLRLTGQRGVTITEITPHPETGNISPINTPGVVLGKGKNIISCPCIFEIGSTSTIVADQHNPETTTADAKGSTSFPHQWTDPKEMHNKNKGIYGATALAGKFICSVSGTNCTGRFSPSLDAIVEGLGYAALPIMAPLFII